MWCTTLDIFSNTFVCDNIADDCLIPGQKKTCFICRITGYWSLLFFLLHCLHIGTWKVQKHLSSVQNRSKMFVEIRMLVCINQSLSLILCVYPTKTLHRYVGHCPLQANSIISFLFLFLLFFSCTHLFRCPWPTMFNHSVQELTRAEPPKFLLCPGNGKTHKNEQQCNF